MVVKHETSVLMKIEKLEALAESSQFPNEAAIAREQARRLRQRLKDASTYRQRASIDSQLDGIFRDIKQGRYGKGWRTETVTNPLTYTPSSSYPFLSIARHYGHDYGAVLTLADIERGRFVHPDKLQPFLPLIEEISEEAAAQINSANALFT